MARTKKHDNAAAVSNVSGGKPAAQRVVHALDYLQHSEQYALEPIIVVAGSDAYLRRLVIDTLIARYQHGADIPYQTFQGADLAWRDLASDLVTGSLLEPSSRRLLIVDEADTFVSTHRARLEKYAADPAASSWLVLSVHSFPATTKLYQIVAAQYRIILCNVPEKLGRKSADERIVEWLQYRARQQHAVELTEAAATKLLEMIGPEFGVLDQELARLSMLVWPDKRIDQDLVAGQAGNWKMRTGWELIDAVAQGDTIRALAMLQRLWETDQGDANLIFGQLSWALRQFAAATRWVQRAERAGRKVTLHQALTAAGVRPYQLENAVAQLRQIGRARGSRLYQWLMELDLSLKGSHASPHRARLALEKLIFQLAKPVGQAR